MSFFSRIALGALLLASAPLAAALTLGEHHGLSRLGSPLAVDIPVLGVGEGAEGLRADVPRFSEHARLGAPEPIVPKGLSARVLLRQDGRAVVRVESPDGVMEPVLRFLVRVRWSGGEVVRGYEMLLDPPAYTPRAVMPPAVAPRDMVAEATAPRAVAPQAPGSGISRARLAAPATVRPPATAGQRYGPVARGDTLYSIVKRAYPGPSLGRAADLESTANAVFAANPQAFAGASRDRLMQGAFLMLPLPGEISGELPGELDVAGSGGSIATASTSQPSPAATPVGERFATVRPGDGLYAIARRVSAAPEADIPGIARALFAANPQAFMANDMNRLIAGATLRVDGVSSAGVPASSVASTMPGTPAAAVAASSPAQPTASLSMDGSLTSGLRETLNRERSLAGELRSSLAASRARLEALQRQREELSRQVDEKNAAIEQALARLASRAAQAPAPASKPAATVQAATPAPAPAQPAAAPPAPARNAGSRLETLLGSLSLTSPLVLGGLAAVLVLLLGGGLLLRRRRTVARDPHPDESADVEALRQRLADHVDDEDGFAEEPATVLHIGTDSEDLEFTRTLDAGDEEPGNVVRSVSARANDLAKQAAISIAYEDYSTAQHYIDEAILLEPHRDEHKMVLLTIHECMGEPAKARELMDDLMARKEQMSGAVRAQVEQMSRRQHS